MFLSFFLIHFVRENNGFTCHFMGPGLGEVAHISSVCYISGSQLFLLYIEFHIVGMALCFYVKLLLKVKGC